MKHAAVLALSLGMLAGAFAKSPSEEFEEKMRPHRKPQFVLPAAADSQLQDEELRRQQENTRQPPPAVRVIDVGRRYTPNQHVGADSERLGEAIRLERSQEQRNRPTELPQPRRMVCEGSPPTCMMR